MTRKITVELPPDEAMFVIAALDRASANAYAAARKMRALGMAEGKFELDVQDTAAAKSDAARKRIADALWPPVDPRWEQRLEEAEMGLA